MFTVPEKKKIRLIIDADTKNEADDAFAIVHALLTPKFYVKGVIGAHFGESLGPDSMIKSYEESRKVVELMGMQDTVPVCKGNEKAIQALDGSETSEGAELIIREALSDDPHPLFVIFLGPITDMAVAYLKCPEIADKVTVIWIGGGKYPHGGREFNLSNDVIAANVIFGSPIRLWQIPSSTYGQMMISLTEMEEKVAPCGKVGEYLFGEIVNVNDRYAEQMFWPMGESWSLGDSAAIGPMLDPMFSGFDMMEAPVVKEDMTYEFTGEGRKIRVYHNVNPRFIIEDFYSKLRKWTRTKEV